MFIYQRVTGTLLFVDVFTNLVGGIPTPLKNGVKVSWDDDIPNRMEK